MHHIRWFNEARDKLADMWLDADSDLREDLTLLIPELERQLTRDPYNAGESRTGESRVEFLEYLGVSFEVDDATDTVWVSDVWYI